MAGELIWRKRGFKAALENPKGAKIDGTQALITYDDDINLDTEDDDRPGPGLYMGDALIGQPGIAKAAWNPKVEMRGNGAHGMEAGLAMLLQACGFKKDSEAYAVHSSPADYKTLSVDGWEDGVKKGMRGAMGNVIFTAETGKKMMCEFNFDGVWITPTAEAMPSFSPSETMPMKMRSGTFTISPSPGGIAKRISRVSLDMKMQMQMLWDPSKGEGIAYNMIGYGTPEISFDIEGELIADYDIYGIWSAGAPAAIVLMVNDGTDKATFTMPKVQYRPPQEDKRENLLVYNAVGRCLHSAGNDSVSITVAAM